MYIEKDVEDILENFKEYILKKFRDINKINYIKKTPYLAKITSQFHI